MKIYDIVIPFHNKDSENLPYCIQGVRKNLSFNNIFVVSSIENKDFIDRFSVTFIDEDKVIEGLTSKSFTGKRLGWYLQQLIKLGMADIVETDYYLFVDTDTVFFRQVDFFSDTGKPLYATAEEYYKPYFRKFYQLFGFNANREYSFIVHHMIFSKKMVKKMRADMQGGQKWYLNILKDVNLNSTKNELISFSEQETYGHYLKKYYSKEFIIRDLEWENVGFFPNKYTIFRLSSVFDYCSFHLHRRYNQKPKSLLNWLKYCYNFERWLFYRWQNNIKGTRSKAS